MLCRTGRNPMQSMVPTPLSSLASVGVALGLTALTAMSQVACVGASDSDAATQNSSVTENTNGVPPSRWADLNNIHLVYERDRTRGSLHVDTPTVDSPTVRFTLVWVEPDHRPIE